MYCLRPDIWEEAKAAEEVIGYSIIKGTYLKDLEPRFKEMRDILCVVPTDKTNSARFWKQVREALPEGRSEIPCAAIWSSFAPLVKANGPLTP